MIGADHQEAAVVLHDRLVMGALPRQRERHERAAVELKHGYATGQAGMNGHDERRPARLFLLTDNDIGAAVDLARVDLVNEAVGAVYEVRGPGLGLIRRLFVPNET